MLYGLLWVMLLGAGGFLLSKQASMSVWAITLCVVTPLVAGLSFSGFFLKTVLWVSTTVMVILAMTPLRKRLITPILFRLARQAMPVMSLTEREALEAGTIGWEGDLFGGSPDFDVLLHQKPVYLTREEQDFLDGPTTELCRLLDDWDITHCLSDLPEVVWSFIKEKGFLGMIIPKRYGGLEFSATAQMSVLVKLYGHSITAASTVSVPNSLGPAELLLKYGTEAQKNYYLPRLANGRDIPCFALTGPNAGSDAASIPDKGIVCRQVIDGEEVLGMRLTWNKRYITLCPVATVIGLAFRLFDPDRLLGKEYDLGISCALIPADTPGVIRGRRHFPLNTAFLNGPTQGTDVFVPIDCLIGGPDMAGHGWRMLMECLSAGRAIGLPASAVGGAQAVAMASGAYARIRKQFNQPIGKFEGIEEPLARIAGNTYLIDAGLMMTVASIDHGAKPAVAGAILKYHTTERARQMVIDAMDIHGGKGICLGPNNYLGRGYQGSPISITVEGANILSRSLIIFGQGAIRCHPYVFQEMESLKNNDLVAFDNAFWGHIGFFISNLTRSWGFSLTDGRWIKASYGPMTRYYQLIHRYSNHLAFLSDFSMMMLGSTLKRKEKLSARLGDILSYLYLASAVLKRFHEDGSPESDLPLVAWSCQQLFYETELAIQGVIDNFPARWARLFLKGVVQPWGLRRRKPSDHLGAQLAELLMTPNATRDRLTRLVFSDPIPTCPLGRLEAAFHKVHAVAPLEKKIQNAVKEGHLSTLTFLEQIQEAWDAGLIDDVQATSLLDAEYARQEAIAVDDFSHDELSRIPGASLSLGHKKIKKETLELEITQDIVI